MLSRLTIMVLAFGLFCSNVSALKLNFDEVKGGDSKAKPFTSLGDNDVSGIAASEWYFKNANVSGGEGIKDADVSENEKSSYTFTIEGNNFNFVTFTIALSGDITKHGGSGGTMPTYSLTGRRDGELYIEPVEAVIPAGGSITFYGKEKFLKVVDPTGAKECNWALQPVTYKVAGEDYTPDPVYLVESTTCPISPSSNYKTPDPGSYTVKAKASPSSENNWVNATLDVIGIDRIEKIAIADEVFMKTLAVGSDTDYELFIEKSKSLSLKTFPLGGSTWPDEQPVWSSSGSWWFSDHIVGDDEGVDTVQINTTGEDDIFTITVSCGTSSKSVACKTFNYKFNLYVDDPTWDNSPFSLSLLGDIDVGHAWWKLELSNNLTGSDVDITANTEYINIPVGYWPKVGLTAHNDFSAPGKLKINDNSHSPNKSKIEVITRNNFNSGLKYTKTASSDSTYVLAQKLTITETPDEARLPVGTYCDGKTERNCTTVAFGAADASGVNLPSAYQEYTGSWFTLGGYLKGTFKGNSPSQLANGF